MPGGESSLLAAAMIEALEAPTATLDAIGAVGAMRTHEMHSVDTEAEKLVALFAQATTQNELAA